MWSRSGRRSRVAEALSRLAWEMTISREEFERILPGATGCAPARLGPLAWGSGDAQRSWTARIEPLDDLVLGAMRLPRHRVALELRGFAEDERRRWLARWEVNFRRGGG